MFVEVTKKQNNLALVAMRDKGLNFNLVFINNEENGEMTLPTMMRLDFLEKPAELTIRSHWSTKHGNIFYYVEPEPFDPLISIQLSLDIFTRNDVCMNNRHFRTSKPTVNFFACDYQDKQLDIKGTMLCERHYRTVDGTPGRHLCMELRLCVVAEKSSKDEDDYVRVFTEQYHHSKEIVKEFESNNQTERNFEVPIYRTSYSPTVFSDEYSLSMCPSCKFYKKRYEYENMRYMDMKNLDR